MAEPVQAVGLMVWGPAESKLLRTVSALVQGCGEREIAGALAQLAASTLLPLGATAVPDDGWVSVEERMPSRADADDRDEVMVWGPKYGAGVGKWFDMRENGVVITHWRRLPPGPGGER